MVGLGLTSLNQPSRMSFLRTSWFKYEELKGIFLAEVTMEKEYALQNCIFETVTGSHAYGTNIEGSDVDLVGVMIPGPKYFLGFDRVEEFTGFGGEEDRKFYEIRKAVGLILDNNPNMLDLLWAPDRCIQKVTPWWESILEVRDCFLSKRCRYTFSGYAIAQLRRIKVHRKFLLNPPKAPPSRTEMGLPEVPIFPTAQLKAVCFAALEMIPEDSRHKFFMELDELYAEWVVPLFARYLDPNTRGLAMEWLQVGIASQARSFQSLGTQYLKDEYFEMASKETAFLNQKKEWEQYQQWAKSRNKKRAELEERCGFDSKHAAHLVRLCRMGEEILSSGKVNVDRTHIDAEELKEIRNGAWPYEWVEQYAKDMDIKLGELYKTSTIPHTVNRKKVESVCLQVVTDYLSKKAW
jgi:uncharacterized protein